MYKFIDLYTYKLCIYIFLPLILAYWVMYDSGKVSLEHLLLSQHPFQRGPPSPPASNHTGNYAPSLCVRDSIWNTKSTDVTCLRQLPSW